MVFLFLMMLLVACDVFGRYVLDHPIPGAGDAIEQSMVLLVFLLGKKVTDNIPRTRLSEEPALMVIAFCLLLQFVLAIVGAVKQSFYFGDATRFKTRPGTGCNRC